MSSHYIYVFCSTEGCGSSEMIYTGDIQTDLFHDSGPRSWEGEAIYIKCKKCLEGAE